MTRQHSDTITRSLHELADKTDNTYERTEKIVAMLEDKLGALIGETGSTLNGTVPDCKETDASSMPLYHMNHTLEIINSRLDRLESLIERI